MKRRMERRHMRKDQAETLRQTLPKVRNKHEITNQLYKEFEQVNHYVNQMTNGVPLTESEYEQFSRHNERMMILAWVCSMRDDYPKM